MGTERKSSAPCRTSPPRTGSARTRGETPPLDGVLTIIEKAHFSNHAVTKSFAIKGRVLGISIKSFRGPPSELHIVNVHDQELDMNHKAKLEIYIRGIFARVGRGFLVRNAFVVGDFNFEREGDSRLSIAKPMCVAPPAKKESVLASNPRWLRRVRRLPVLAVRQRHGHGLLLGLHLHGRGTYAYLPNGSALQFGQGPQEHAF